MDTFLQDLRFAVRSLTKSRGISTIATACLALGIGANTAIFSVVRTVLLESLPYRDASRIVRIYETGIFNGTRGLGSVSVPNFRDWRAQNDAFEAIAAYSSSSADLVGNGQPERVRAVSASANLFAILGTKPELGRTFALDEDEAERAPVVVLSDGFWRRRFGADQTILGKQISLKDRKSVV